MSKTNQALNKLPELFRCENLALSEALKKLEQFTQAHYSHEEVYGEFCIVHQYIACPPQQLFAYLRDPCMMEQWTFSLREFREISPGLYVAQDQLVEDTLVYFKVKADEASYKVEHHCAWDQSEHLWMRYQFYVIDAMPLLNKAGSILLWLNCKHPYYDMNTQEKVPQSILASYHKQNRKWIGEYWRYFPAAHKLEANNLKQILEQGAFSML